MRIAIDARMMAPGNTRGIGRYVEELVRAMLAAAPEHQYVLIVRSAEHPFAGHPSVETIVADIPWYGLAEQIRMPGVLRSARADRILIPHWNVPLLCPRPFVVTIHDLLLRHAPHSAKASTRSAPVRWIKRIGYRITLAHALRSAERILVPTRFVAKDVATFYPAVGSKIVVTGEGMPKLEARHSVLGTPSYLLYVGSAYPHKGVQDLLNAWSGISAKHPDLSLKIAGELDVFMKHLRNEAVKRDLPRVEFLGRVSESQLAGLYDHASAFVFPSHFEGFGLPPLEAIAHGCPVISSDAEALTDVLGPDGAIFFRAGDPNAILAAVERFLNDPTAARERTIRSAEQLASRHSWKEAATRTLAALGDDRFRSPSWLPA